MSKKEDFHPALSTLDVAKFQLMENGFAGVTNGVTLVPAKDAPDPEAQRLYAKLVDTLALNAKTKYLDDTGDALDLLQECEKYLETMLSPKTVAVLVVYKPSVEEGKFNVQPVARIIDPWEVTEPELAHTDGAGNVKKDDGVHDSTGVTPGNRKDGPDSGTLH